jgi:hypothetical protein
MNNNLGCHLTTLEKTSKSDTPSPRYAHPQFSTQPGQEMFTDRTTYCGQSIQVGEKQGKMSTGPVLPPVEFKLPKRLHSDACGYLTDANSSGERDTFGRHKPVIPAISAPACETSACIGGSIQWQPAGQSHPSHRNRPTLEIRGVLACI